MCSLTELQGGKRLREFSWSNLQLQKQRWRPWSVFHWQIASSQGQGTLWGYSENVGRSHPDHDRGVDPRSPGDVSQLFRVGWDVHCHLGIQLFDVL